MPESSGWLADKQNDPEFQRLCAREGLIEDFLTRVELEMAQQGINRKELARRMACAPSDITQMFQRTKELTAVTMIDVAFHLKLQVKLLFEPLETEHCGGR